MGKDPLVNLLRLGMLRIAKVASEASLGGSGNAAGWLWRWLVVVERGGGGGCETFRGSPSVPGPAW